MKPFLAAIVLMTSVWVPAGMAASNLPPGYVPVRVHKNADPVFPSRLLMHGITHGEATVVLEIDHEGRVLDQLVTGYTHREFADQALRAVRRWTFEPGTLDGQPIGSILTANFEFTVNGILVYEKRFEDPRPDQLNARTLTYFAHGAQTLDRTPVPVRVEPPAYPKEWLDAGRGGSVTVRFYIDEEGRTRFPVTAAKTDDLLARAAVAAIREWRFQPPTAAGRPVLAYAEQTFVFDPNAAKRG